MNQTLAENLAALMARFPDELGTQEKVAARSGHAIDQTTVGRILKQKHKVTMTTLAALADACGVEPYQMLIPGLNPGNPQVLRALSAAEERLYKALEDARKNGTQ